MRLINTLLYFGSVGLANILGTSSSYYNGNLERRQAGSSLEVSSTSAPGKITEKQFIDHKEVEGVDEKQGVHSGSMSRSMPGSVFTKTSGCQRTNLWKTRESSSGWMDRVSGWARSRYNPITMKDDSSEDDGELMPVTIVEVVSAETVYTSKLH
ncbi:hypothetical protein AYI68_g1555 [Smittium mucronatum]|uniref:Uncharacterized protein n=1 Tax=Smittium mucronatum TaxID=133383 RepID=A0A1R0GMQ7_9FUNG|nr:hypothetical protein AYI68_g7772 [Smittium mucronatum]OLY84282.1 hypothetical protein AYI68_g1555 [Smittium mucronatum]